jgi:predicted AlkP superfamily pyrophosphatase or phosphodiesterase
MSRRLAVLVAASAWTLAVDPAAGDVHLEAVSVAPARPHFVAPGATTTFVIAVRTDSAVPEAAVVEVQAVAASQGSWSATLSPADELFRPSQPGSEQMAVSALPDGSGRVVVSLRAPEGLSEGALATATVRARTQGFTTSSIEVGATVRHRPKLIYVAIDGCGRGYLALDRRGSPYDGIRERLMPNAWRFLEGAAWMRAASSGLPAVTDPNHLAALTGAWAGTLGVYQVNGLYMGVDADGRPVMEPPTPDAVRWGTDGRPVRSVFDLAKDPAEGGAPAAFNAMVTGKPWLADFVYDRLDLVANGSDHPYYVPPPAAYRLGDPPSDEDAGDDFEGTNPGPRLLRHRFSLGGLLADALPSHVPSDRWIVEAAVRTLQAEDPDVLYVNLANTDVAQHVFGAADRPEEWVDPGTPDRLWDDESIYNRNANRDPVLDVVREADWGFGAIVQALVSRDAVERAVVVLLSDHGLVTAMGTADTVVDLGSALMAAGVLESTIERLAGRGQLAHVFMSDPTKTAEVEAILESYEQLDPVEGRTVRPLLAINRAEMDTGVDAVSGPFGGDGLGGNHRGELYSEWSIEAPVTDNSKVRWPDLFVFTRGHFRTEVTSEVSQSGSGAPMTGVHGAPSSADVIAGLAGPGIRAGTHDQPATLADLGATLFALLGGRAPSTADGQVLHGILEATSQP